MNSSNHNPGLFRPLDSSRLTAFLRAAVMLLLTWLVIPAACAGGTANVGESIYQHGVLGSGALLEALHEGGAPMKGQDAACINCHRRTGFGSKEGNIVIPPIAGRYLLQSDSTNRAEPDLPYVETMRLNRTSPYTDQTLARAIREGIDADGKALNYLMPHYALKDADMAALIDYLKHLDQRDIPGVTDTELHFATIITPDADPAKRNGMLDVLQHYFADRNAAQFAMTPHLRPSRRGAWANHMFRVHYHWQLHVWQLSGPADTWKD